MSQSGLLKMWAKCIVPGVMTAGTLSALALSGCDTVARLSFSDRVFNDVRLVGFTSTAGACKGSNGDAVMRFVLADGDGNPIDNTTVIGSSAVSLSRDDITIGDVTLFDLPDVDCSTTGRTCSKSFACDATNMGNSCQLNDTIGVNGDPTMISEITSQQGFAVLVENSASMHGTLPSTLGNLFPDYQGGADGGPDGKSDAVGSNFRLNNSARATDDNESRVTAVSNLEQTWEVVFERAATDNNVRSGFGLWTFGGTLSELSSVVPGESEWVYSANNARQTARALDPAQSFSVAAVYESMIEVIQGDERFGQFTAGDEKILTVIVDGPDDLRSPMIDAQAVIDAASAAGVRVFIVHLDPLVDVRTASGSPLIPDVPSYVQRQDTACDPANENACKNFEVCRKVTAYSTNAGTNVTTPAEKIDGTYCAIDYKFVDDEQVKGRIGPISEYAEIACATGGGYLYFPSRDKLSDGNGTVAKLPLALDSLWEVPVDVSSFKRGDVEAGEPYKAGLTFSTTVNGTQKRDNMTEDFINVRPVIFSAE